MAKHRHFYVANNKEEASESNLKEELQENNQQDNNATQEENTKETETINTALKESIKQEDTKETESTNVILEELLKQKIAKQEQTTKDSNKSNQRGFTPVYKVELALNNYLEAMDTTKPINPTEGGRWQYSLFTTIRDTLNAPNQQEFNKEWNTFLNFFNKNKVPALTEKFAFRFAAEWPGSPVEWKIFRRLLYLIINTADPATRKKNLLEINLDIINEDLTENQKNKINTFYS